MLFLPSRVGMKLRPDTFSETIYLVALTIIEHP